jgi:hypothetical protein
MKSQIGDQDEKECPHLKNGHSRIVDGIEGFNRDVEPFAVKAIHPVMGEHEKYNPPHQQPDIHHGAPGQNFSYDFNCHGSSSFMILLHHNDFSDFIGCLFCGVERVKFTWARPRGVTLVVERLEP